ncbi:hypothetical protein [Stenomitos frigidus]|uniref:Glycosyl transferase family 1 n=1 Tax=Stenomitos frigidus ULC18 TaxID=2107698 RepID=A0A2T1E1S4_9CYAN|nr:hypothetical protein [Stenomitos frigidus]PSB26705.1 hypothetical protein C7B82_19080 [Stenomitos frigidus ULC18]
MIHVTLIAGTYEPTQCGVANDTDRLRTHLNKLGVQSVVMTTYDAAQTAQNPNVKCYRFCA